MRRSRQTTLWKPPVRVHPEYVGSYEKILGYLYGLSREVEAHPMIATALKERFLRLLSRYIGNIKREQRLSNRKQRSFDDLFPFDTDEAEPNP